MQKHRHTYNHEDKSANFVGRSSALNNKSKLLRPTLFLLLCGLTLVSLAACAIGGTPAATPTSTVHVGNSTATSGTSATSASSTPTSAILLGPQPCPTAVSSTTYWDPIIPTQNGVSAVGRVTCGHLIGRPSLQALILVGYSGTGHIIDCYVYDNITSPSPTKLFALQGLYKGDVKISAYNTVMTAEVDLASSVNKNSSNAGLTLDLFREFKWSDGAGTLVPVSFPGIFPDLTRYQAEADQQQVNQGHQPWKLQATMVANTLAVSLLNWPTTATTTLLSGGGTHDTDAVVAVKNNKPAASTIQVALSRLEGNTNGGIWLATAVTTTGMSITAPQNRDRLTSPTTVTGTGNAFEAVIGKIIVLDHLYNDIGHIQAKGATGNGNTTFSAHVSYTSSFKAGAQEGLIALYSYSNADGSIAGAVIMKELLS